MVRPRFENIPTPARSSASEVLDLLDLLGMPLLPWQRYTLGLQLGEREDGSWAAPWVVEIAPRQNGKSHKWAGRILGGLFVLGEDLITYTAHKVDTALEVFNLVDRYARSHPATEKLIARTVTSQGRECIELTTGQRFRIMARTRSGGRGFTGDCLIFDEALELRDQASLNALVPTLATRPNNQLIFASSAGDPGSVVLANLRDRGRRGDPQICYIEYSAPEDVDADDEAAWWAANPALGDLMNIETIRRERQIMSLDGFRQERLGIWAAEVAQRVIPVKPWATATRTVLTDPTPGHLGLAFDVATDRSWATIVVAYPVGPATHVRVARHDLGDGWLVDQAAALADRYAVPVTFDDAGPARDIGEALRVAGVPVVGLSGRDYAAACARFLSGVVNATVTHHPDLPLDEAAVVATTRKVGEGWAFARRASNPAVAPISPITAAAMAVWAAAHPPAPAKPAARPEVY